MQSKTFLTILFSMSTIIILLGIYFIGSYITLQNSKDQQSALQRFDNSTIVHKYLFDNITGLKRGLDPIIAIIPNASQSRVDQLIHYNQTTQDFKTIKRILEIKLQDHDTLAIINATVNEINDMLKNHTSQASSNVTIITNGTDPIPLPTPVPAPNNNTDDGGVIVENITGKNSTILK